MTDLKLRVVELYARVLTKNTYTVHAARGDKTLCGVSVPADAREVQTDNPLLTIHDRARGCLRCERILLAHASDEVSS